MASSFELQETIYWVTLLYNMILTFSPYSIGWKIRENSPSLMFPSGIGYQVVGLVSPLVNLLLTSFL
jgi:hypothetical protein